MPSTLATINRFSRWTLAFVFFYHGLVPKILWPSAIERAMVEANGFSIPANLISYAGGTFEMMLAILILFYKTSLIPVYMAAALIVFLSLDVAILMPELLVEAFNPVSINIAIWVLCYITYLSQNGMDVVDAH